MYFLYILKLFALHGLEFLPLSYDLISITLIIYIVFMLHGSNIMETHFNLPVYMVGFIMNPFKTLPHLVITLKWAMFFFRNTSFIMVSRSLPLICRTTKLIVFSWTFLNFLIAPSSEFEYNGGFIQNDTRYSPYVNLTHS